MGRIIIEKNQTFSQFKSILNALKGEHKKYNWLITEIDFVPGRKNKLVLAQPHTWVLGEELEQLFRDEAGFWAWGVFSGFSKELTLDEVLQFSLPYADGNPDFWQ